MKKCETIEHKKTRANTNFQLPMDSNYLLLTGKILTENTTTEGIHKMKIKTFTVFNSIILAALLLINLWIYLNRNNDFAYKDILTYNQLYTPQESDRISNFLYRGKDSVEIIISTDPKNKTWLINQNDSSFHYYGKNPIVKLHEGKNKYSIRSSDNLQKPPIELGLNLSTAESYRREGRTLNSDCEIFYSNTLIGNYTLYPLEKWQQQFPHTTSAEEDLATTITRDSMRIGAADSSIAKIKKIANYILKGIDQCRGIPSDIMDSLSPLKQFSFAKNSRSKIWCGNFTNIFSYFANNAGVLTRYVAMEGKVGDVFKSPHVFNECFIKEYNTWILVDLTSKAICVKNSSGEFLNTIDLYNSHKLNANNLIVTTFEKDSIKEVAYSKIKDFYDYFFNQNTSFLFYYGTQFDENLYNPISKIKRYISKSPTCANYSESVNTDNKKFYMKIFFFYSLLAFLAYWILFLVIAGMIAKNKKA